MNFPEHWPRAQSFTLFFASLSDTLFREKKESRAFLHLSVIIKSNGRAGQHFHGPVYRKIVILESNSIHIYIRFTMILN